MKKNTQTIIKADMYYTITGTTGRVLESAGDQNGAAVVLGNYDHAPHQEWAFTRVGEGVYQIANRATGKMLDLVSGGTSDGTWIHLWEDAGCSSQMWMVSPTNDGHVKLKTQLSLDKCMDVVGMSTDLGNRVQIWQDVNGEYQTWTISEVKAKRIRATKTPEEKAAAAAKRAEKAATTKATAAKETAPKAVAPKKATTRKAATAKATTTKSTTKATTTTKPTTKKTATKKVAVKKETV